MREGKKGRKGCKGKKIIEKKQQECVKEDRKWENIITAKRH